MGRGIRTTISAICATAVASATLTGVVATPATAAPVAKETGAATVETYCDVSVSAFTQWSSGYGAALTVRNISQVTVRWQRLDLRFPGPIWSVQTWNASYVQTAQQTTILPSPNSGLLGPGQTVMVGTIYASGSISAPPQREVICSPI